MMTRDFLAQVSAAMGQVYLTIEKIREVPVIDCENHTPSYSPITLLQITLKTQFGRTFCEVCTEETIDHATMTVLKMAYAERPQTLKLLTPITNIVYPIERKRLRGQPKIYCCVHARFMRFLRLDTVKKNPHVHFRQMLARNMPPTVNQLSELPNYKFVLIGDVNSAMCTNMMLEYAYKKIVQLEWRHMHRLFGEEIEKSTIVLMNPQMLHVSHETELADIKCVTSFQKLLSILQ